MLFTDIHTQTSYINNIFDRTKQGKTVFSINTRPNSNPNPNQLQQIQIPSIQIPSAQQQLQQQQQQPKKMKWGEPTWILFHTLAEKVNENTFSQIRVELLNTIYSICANLPCPDCAEHATTYLNGINFKTIQTKEQLKYMLYTFHNTVNAKKGVELFPITHLDKYSQMNLINVIYTFIPFLQDKSNSIRMIANDFHRTRMVSQLKIWFNTYISYFDR
jgi:hypothetical protein